MFRLPCDVRSLIRASIAALALVGGCGHAFWRTEVVALTRPPAGMIGPVTIGSPVKAHLIDGSTVIFRRGASIGYVAVEGDGVRYPFLQAAPSRTVSRVPFDSIVGLETFEGKQLVAQSLVVSAAATAVTAVATVGLLKALFGSCPTVYADTGTGPVLEAEGFSYAIAPLLEQRDVDALHARPDSDGVIRLELRNEALETHYINNIELIAVPHRVGSRVVPDQNDRVLIVEGLRPLSAAHDRAGRDMLPVLSAPDGQLFASATATVSSAREGDLDDWLDIEARDLPPGDSVAVVLRLRNSLLNTVLLYEGMLGGRDAPGWLDVHLQRISSAIDLAEWYTRTMGLRVSVDGAPRSANGDLWHARLSDVGPIAFRDVAIVLPRPSRDARSVRVRLRFVADNWRIDYAGVASTMSRPTSKMIPLSRVVVHTPDSSSSTFNDTAAVAALREADGRYLETMPGQRMMLEFAATAQATSQGTTTTYLIAWQGWYREWVRGAWLAAPVRTVAWTPGDGAMLTALRRWQSHQVEMERAFYSTRIPVR
ncbi:MAG TPA: hypothetical protein VGQ56_03090 [Gemmatimonadaceae bacterium]|jgi:hypothetical protein|nr:hypothetical protein [Gemmatimonadaceae bacterium]